MTVENSGRMYARAKARTLAGAGVRRGSPYLLMRRCGPKEKKPRGSASLGASKKPSYQNLKLMPPRAMLTVSRTVLVSVLTLAPYV
jgi:hypothetical protein